MESLNFYAGERADRSLRGYTRGSGCLDVDIGDVANVNMGGEEIEGGDIQVFKNKLDFGILVFSPIERKKGGGGSEHTCETKGINIPRDRKISQYTNDTREVDSEHVLPEPCRPLHERL